MNSKQLAVIAAKQEIQTREQFKAALAHVNALVKQPDITVEAAKGAMTKAEALRAWASFDKRLTVEEKKEANRAMTRTVRMLAEVAGREQPRGVDKHGAIPGPLAWLRRELGVSNSAAQCMRTLVTKSEIYQTALVTGRHWVTVLTSGSSSHRGGDSVLRRVGRMVRNTNTLAHALKIHPNYLGVELSRIRKIRAWCEAYEHALVQRRARESAVRK